MALFQIAEPGLSAAPHEHRLAVGIDLGTTNSLAATVKSGEPVVLADEAGRQLLPSVVRYLKDGSVETGWDALAHAESDPRNTVYSAKRLLARGRSELKTLPVLPYEIVDAPGGVAIRTVQGDKSPVEVSAEILKTLAKRAETQLGGELTGAVITVPAYFDDAQRQATKDAGKIAGLEVKRIINEPTAAALAYGVDKESSQKIMVYDLGGGTFDVSLLKLSRGVFEVLGTGGNAALGGDDFDHAVVDWAVSQLGSVELTAEDRRQLLDRAKAAKEALTDTPETVLKLELSSGTHAFTLTRVIFDQLTKSLVDETLEAVANVLRDAKLEKDQIKGVVLVGGSTRMPCVRREVEAYFGFAPLTGIDPDCVVAVGAAMQANKLAGNAAEGEDWLLLDVTPLSLGIETMGGLVEKIIPRNSPIPVARAQDFTTFRDGQTAMAVHVVQGEREVVDACRSLARFELRGIPPMAAGAARIRVTFQVDADVLLSVSAREMTSGAEASIVVKPSYGLTDEEIVRMLQEGNSSAEADMQARKLREEQVEAKRLLESTASALTQDGDLLSPEEQSEIDRLARAVGSAINGTDADMIHKAVEALSKGTEAFAERRMDRSIRAALAGRSVNDALFDEKPSGS